MQNTLRAKLLAILVIAGVAIWAFTPPSTKIKLGLDLRGGVHLVLGVQTDDAIRLETETSAEQLKAALADAKISVTTTPGLSEFTVAGVPTASDQQFRTIADTQVGLSYNREPGANQTYVFRMKPNVMVDTRRLSVTQAIETIERRVNELGVSEPTIAEYGNAGNQIMVQLPGVTDVARAKGIIKNTALLEWKLVEAGPAPDQASLLQPYGGQVPAEMAVVSGAGDVGQEFYLVRRVAALTGRDLRTARSSIDEYNQPAVAFTLNSEGVVKFSRVTSDNVGRLLAILLDGQVRSAPVIQGPITQADARITGRFTQEEVADLSLVLRSGALPASLTYQEERLVGPTLGADSVRAGLVASLAGLGLVTAFMLFYYRLAGMNAFVSIALNLTVLMGLMSGIGAVMTLPGIAGFILTIGMGVDSNVLIFERIREELRANKGAKAAVSAGFGRVLWTIVDTHVASLLAALLLLNFGTGPIRGFAVTLILGLISNVFTAVFVSRTMFELILSNRPAGAARLSI